MTAAKTKADVRLLITVERDRFGDRYFHPIARPIYVMHDEQGDHVRNPQDGWGNPARELADFQIRAQGHPEHQGGEVYGFHAEYREVFSIDLERAQLMAATLKKVERGMSKLNTTLGYVADGGAAGFAAYVARVANVLGISLFGFRVEGDDSAYDRNTYRWIDASYLATYIDSQINRVREQVTP